MDRVVVRIGSVGLGGRSWCLMLDFTVSNRMASGPSYFTSLCLTCKMGMIIILAS